MNQTGRHCKWLALNSAHFPAFPLRLQFEERNQKKEAKEMAVIEALKRKDDGEKSQAVAQ